MISYEPLRIYLEKNGRSINYLRSNNVINSNAAQAISEDKPITLTRIKNICLFLDIPIEQVVMIKR